MLGTAFNVAVAEDIGYIVDLEHKNKESLGFLPKMAIEARLTAHRIFIGRLNGEPFGYLLFDYRDGPSVHVLQACIQYDARRRLYGAALYGFGLERWQMPLVTLKCAADLESNLFWRSLGLVCTDVRAGGRRRGRKINVWAHFLRPGHLLFAPDELARVPAFQQREDCADQETGFLADCPDGFTNSGSLGKLAWSNRKKPRLTPTGER